MIIAVFAAYSLLTLALTYPLVTRLGTHFIGNGDDMWVHYWNHRWVKHTHPPGGALFYTRLLFHPTGVSLVYHNFAWVNIALWLVLEPLTGGVAAYNLVHLIHIPLCGLAMFLLARRLTKSEAAAFASGLTYAFWPYRTLDVNHPNMISTEGFPLLMLALIQLFDGDSPVRYGILLGVLTALIGYTRWQLLILAAVLVVLYLLYILVWNRARWTWHRAAGLALGGLVALSLMAPGLYPLARDQVVNGSVKDLYRVSADDPEQDLLAWAIPHHQHPLGRPATRAFSGYGRSTARGRYAAYMGYAALALAIVGVVANRTKKRTSFWVGTGLLCFLFALGPTLQVNGRIYERVPMPYRLIGWLPPIEMLRHPHRFTALLALPVAALVGLGANAVKERVTPGNATWAPVRNGAVLGVASVVILVDYWSIPTSTVSAAVPDFYAEVAAEPDTFALVGLPGERQATERYMFYQTEHERPMLGGHVSRLPPEALTFASSVPLVKDVYRGGRLNTQVTDISHQLSLLKDAGFRYVVLHKQLAEPDIVDEWKAYFAMRPRHEDAEVVAYVTAPQAGLDYTIEHELVPGTGFVHTFLSRDDTAPEPTLDLEIVWGTRTDPPGDVAAQVSLQAETGGSSQTEVFDISPDRPPRTWSANELVRDTYSLKIEPTLSSGLHAVALNLAGRQQRGVVGNRARIGEVVVGKAKAGRNVFPIDRRVGARFGESLLLVGYSLQLEADQVGILLHWRALRAMEEDYKFFVHVFSAETAEVVAQADVMPLDWTYPTSQWAAREVVSDEILVPISEIDQGDYRLLVGVYASETKRRLPIHEVPSGFAVRQDRLELPNRIRR